MAHGKDFTDPDYDRRLAEFKALKEQAKKETVANQKDSTERKY